MNEKYLLFKKHFENNDLEADQLELLITEKCNLNCRGYCSEGGPGCKTMTVDMVRAILRPFSKITTLKILGGEPSRALNIVEEIYKCIDEYQIKINEIWFFSNGVDRKAVDSMCNIALLKPKTVNDTILFISRGKYHDRAIRDIKRTPEEIDENFKYYREKYGRTIRVDKQYDEDIPLNVGNAKDLDNNPVEVSEYRWFVLFGENRIQKLVFSPLGYERPDFCNVEDIPKYTYGHVIKDGMKKILFDGLRLKKEKDEILE